MKKANKALVFRRRCELTHNRLRNGEHTVTKHCGYLEITIDLDGLFRHLGEKASVNTTRRTELLNGLITAQATIKGQLIGERRS
jgi:hypothetical protein